MRLNASILTKFIDELPIPPIQKPLHDTYYEMVMSEFKQRLHKELSDTTVWGYNNCFPGPTISATKGEKLHIKWISNLPDKHLFPIDKTLYDTGNTPDVRNVVHLHGSVNKSDSEGYPTSWFTKNFEEVGPTFNREIYEYENNQPSTMLWYHDHTMGITRLNNYAGLIGLYFIKDENDEALNLPCDKFELPLVIQDKSFNLDGSLYYPRNISDYNEEFKDSLFNNYDDEPISVIPEFFGDCMLVNGKIWPYLNVEPRKYRFRILNGCNSRFINLHLDNMKGFYQIGSDLGLLSHTIKLNTLLLAPAERADIIIDFSTFTENEVILKNNANTPYPNGESPNDNTSVIMKFVINKDIKAQDNSSLPHSLTYLPNPYQIIPNKVRKIYLNHTLDKYNRETMLINNKSWLHKIDILPKLDDYEVWEIYNLTPKAHPIHIHLVLSRVLNIQTFSIQNNNIMFTSNPYYPPLNEQGLKDTIKVMPNTVVRILMKFSPYTGKYVFHCHMLEHEDHSMMRPFEIIK